MPRASDNGGLSTTQRGYGWAHQQARAAALRALVDGTPCPFPWCGKPMARGMALDYDHYPPLAHGGGGIRRLSHARCNRQAGQRIAAQRRTRKRTRTSRVNAVNSRAW